MEIKKIVQDELNKAREKFPRKQSSVHEGYSILLEEVEELKDEMDKISFAMKNLWDSIKKNDESNQRGHITSLRIVCNDLIKESIQVAAMIKRFEEDNLHVNPSPVI